MELAGVAGLVLRAHGLDGELGVVQRPAQAEPTPVALLDVVVAALGVGRHGGGVALLRLLPPQHLVHILRQAVLAGEGDRPAAQSRPVALQAHFT